MLAGLAVGVVTVGGVVADFFPMLNDLISRPQERTYTATHDANLLELHGALLRYHENEGQFPGAATWMDDIKPLIRTTDMPEDEAKKKFVNPDTAVGTYGYTFNDDAAGRYRGDLPSGDTPLVFETPGTAWNAHGGAPASGRFVSVDGKLGTLGAGQP